MKINKMKIALTIPTGRPRVKEVVKAFIKNAIYHGHNSKDFSIYLSIDTRYQNTSEEDFTLDKETEKNVSKVVYISEKDRAHLANEVNNRFNVTPSIAEQLFMGNGYSKQRNSALLLAIKDGNDIAICIDDDEAPFIPVENTEGKIKWKNLDFFGPHIKELSNGADITRGKCLGYFSPIPSDFEKDIPEEIRIKLGEALSYGNDVISSYSFMKLMSKIKCVSETELNNSKEALIIEYGPIGKSVPTGNMGINLHSVRQGKVPIFFTPPNARGEDTIFGLQLKNTIVKEVQSYMFHDPFLMYDNIYKGEFPETLRPVSVTKDTKIRFAYALIGWLKYAPMLIEMTSKSETEKKMRIKEMIDKIGEPTRKLAELLNCREIEECRNVLLEYNKNVDNHLNDLIEAQKSWRELILPNYTS